MISFLLLFQGAIISGRFIYSFCISVVFLFRVTQNVVKSREKDKLRVHAKYYILNLSKDNNMETRSATMVKMNTINPWEYCQHRD